MKLLIAIFALILLSTPLFAEEDYIPPRHAWGEVVNVIDIENRNEAQYQQSIKDMSIRDFSCPKLTDEELEERKKRIKRRKKIFDDYSEPPCNSEENKKHYLLFYEGFRIKNWDKWLNLKNIKQQGDIVRIFTSTQENGSVGYVVLRNNKVIHVLTTSVH